MQKLLILPGWQDSGPEHWQSRWLRKFPNAIKVGQKEWMNPQKDDWVQTLNDYIQKYPNSILIGHSLACATFAHWAKEHTGQLKAALLVCPSDVEQTHFPKEIQGFAPMPLEPLPCKTIVVTSDNDPYVSLERAHFFADKWHAELKNIGPHGHINTDAGFGDWPEGETLLHTLL